MKLYRVHYQYLGKEHYFAGPYKFDALVLPGCSYQTKDTVAVLLFGRWLLLQHGPVLCVTLNNAWRTPVIKDQARWDNIDFRTGWDQLLVLTRDRYIIHAPGYAVVSTATGYGRVQDSPVAKQRGRACIPVDLIYFGLSDLVLVCHRGGKPSLWLELGREENLYEILEDHEEIPWGI